MTANTAFLMAGQGSQEVGMGVPETSVCNGCKRTLQAVDDALGYALSKCMAHGPADELQQTQHAQPAILAMSVMHAQHLMGFGLLPTAVAGHSLGQYAALVVAGALDLGDAARLVSRRGTLMQQAVANRRGSMVAVSGISRDEGKTLCHQASSNGAVVVACFNAPGRLVFSGDVGRSGLPIIRDPAPPEGGADVIIMESTYGNRDHESVEGAREHLAKVVRETAARGGRILIPSFAVGRTQELVYDLHSLHRAGQIPSIPIIVDSPLAFNATAVFELHPEVFDTNEDLIRVTNDLFAFPLMRFTREVSESRALNSAKGPMIIIAASGMAESGRILHHLLHGADDPRNTILIVGFQAEHTLGRRIVERRETLRIMGDDVPLRADVQILNGYSAHGDRTELRKWLDAVRDGGRESGRTTPRVHLVHGEPEAQDAFAESLRKGGYQVDAPNSGETRPI